MQKNKSNKQANEDYVVENNWRGWASVYDDCYSTERYDIEPPSLWSSCRRFAYKAKIFIVRLSFKFIVDLTLKTASVSSRMQPKLLTFFLTDLASSRLITY